MLTCEVIQEDEIKAPSKKVKKSYKPSYCWNKLEESNIEAIKNKILSNWPDTKTNTSTASKKVALMYSGGYDSTRLLLAQLEAGVEVYPIMLIFDIASEITAIVTLTQIASRYPTLLHKPTILYDFYDPIGSINTNGITQQPLTAFYASMIPADIMRDVAEIQIGYVAGDLAISFKKELRGLYTNGIIFKDIMTEDFSKAITPKLTFPLEKVFHFNNIVYVRHWQEANNLVLPVYSCQNPTVLTDCMPGEGLKIKATTCTNCDKCFGNQYAGVAEYTGYLITVTDCLDSKIAK